MDIISDICRGLHLQGQTYFRTRFSGDWAVRVPEDSHRVRFHLVLQGDCVVSLDGKKWLTISEGDWVLIPHGREQLLAHRRDPLKVTNLTDTLPHQIDENGELTLGPETDLGLTRLLCGYCTFDDQIAHPLFESLPDIIMISHKESFASPWLSEAIRMVTLEANQASAGADIIVDRLVEILFIQALRHLQASEDSSSFLVATRDVSINRALSAIHRQPQEPWTVTELSKVAAMSRTQFTERFRETVNRSPNQYLTEWRLMKASQFLRETALPVEEIAERVGYQSGPSLTRRFSKAYGIAPAAYRRDHAKVA